MALSWTIFGAMYISMSDVGENEMSEEKLVHLKHIIRRFFGYLGALFSITLVIYYFCKLFFLNRINSSKYISLNFQQLFIKIQSFYLYI